MRPGCDTLPFQALFQRLSVGFQGVHLDHGLRGLIVRLEHGFQGPLGKRRFQQGHQLRRVAVFVLEGGGLSQSIL